MKRPETRFADSPEGKIAYQVVGEGPIDLILFPGPRSNIDVLWEHPAAERYLRRLASFSRLILANIRGVGPSDPIFHKSFPTLEEWTSDRLWVLDAVGSESAAVMGIEQGGSTAMLFAASYPERTRALVLLNSFAALRRHDDYPAGFPPQAHERLFSWQTEHWGTTGGLPALAPELADDEDFRDWFARLERASMGQTMTASLSPLIGDLDIRGILPSIKAPTLVISHAKMTWVRPQHGRYLAEHIPNARYIERPGFWGIPWVHDVDWTLDEVQEFLTGTRGTPELDDRVLATVLFTDIVGSTSRAAELGDHRWRQLLDQHDTVCRRQIERFRGRALKSTGDGVMATFDGPARAIRCALALKDAVRSLGVEIRIGLHTGEVEQRGEDVGGIAVHIASRVMSSAGASEVIVSGAMPPLVAGSGIEFEDRGAHELKGVPGEWRLYAVRS